MKIAGKPIYLNPATQSRVPVYVFAHKRPLSLVLVAKEVADAIDVNKRHEVALSTSALLRRQ